MFVPRAVVESPTDYEEALRWVFQLPGKWTAGAVDGQSANGRSEPQPTVEGVPAYPPALDPLASARICVQAAEGVPAEAVDRVIKGLSQALSSEPRYGGVSVQAGCRGGYVEPGIWASSDGLLAQIFLPTKQKSDDLGLNKLSSLGYLREPLNPDRCAEKCATAPARLYLKYESFDAPEDLDGDRAGLVTDLRNALFGLR